MPQRPQKAAPPPPREPLTPERIARAALRCIDRDGLDGLSMRRLGQELGVEAMALYHHYPSKGRVLDAVMDLLVEEVVIPEPAAMPPAERLATALRSYRGIAITHPHAFPLLVGRRFNSPGAFAFYERLLQIFAELGLTPQQAACWFRTMGYMASGAGMADIASREQEPDATPLTLQRAPQTLGFPHVAAVAPHLRVENLDAVFEFALGVLMRALLGADPAGAISVAARRRGSRAAASPPQRRAGSR